MKEKNVEGRRPDPNLILNSLREIINIFNKHNLKYWLETGNLLGAVRTGRLIPWDVDVDIGCETNDKGIEKVAESLRNNGWKVDFLRSWFLMADREGYAHIDIHFYDVPLWMKPISMGCSILPRFMRRGMLRLAQVTYFSNDDLRPVKAEIRDYRKKYRFVQLMMPVFFCYKTKTIEFYDFEAKIPQHPEDYLFLNYGSDWRTPKEKFTTYIG